MEKTMNKEEKKEKPTLRTIDGGKKDGKPDIKTVAIMLNNRIFVGNPEWEEVYDDSDAATGEWAVASLKDVYMMDALSIPMPAEGGIGIASAVTGIPIGKAISIPIDAFVVELRNDSPIYIEYIRLSSGIELAKPVRGPVHH